MWMGGASCSNTECAMFTPYTGDDAGIPIAAWNSRPIEQGVAGLVPEGWVLSKLEVVAGDWCAKIYHRDMLALEFGAGPTVEAAIKNAAEKVKP